MKPPPEPPQPEAAPPDRVFPSHHLKCGSIQIPLWLRLIGHLSTGARLVYGTLVWAAGPRKAVSNHSLSYLAAAAGISERTFQRHLRELEHHDLIRTAEPSGNETHQRYHFLKHECMYIPEAHLQYIDDPSRWQSPTANGYKASAESVDGVIRWIMKHRHETGWDAPRESDDD